MTIVLNRPGGDAGRDVRARREAALERLNGGSPRTVDKGPRKGSVRRAKPSRRAIQQPNHARSMCWARPPGTST